MSYRVDSNLVGVKVASDATSYTLAVTDDHYVAYVGQTITLPSLASSLGRTFFIKLGSTATSAVTINAAGSDTIEGASSYTLETDYDFVELVGGSSTWLISKESNIRIPVSSWTTSATLSRSDEGGLIQSNSTSAIVATVPPNSSVAFPVGTQIILARKNTGAFSVTPGSGVTINSVGSNSFISTQYGAATLVKVATNEWYLFGDLSAS